MAILSWILWGLFVGAIARLLRKGRQPIGVAWTIILGVVGVARRRLHSHRPPPRREPQPLRLRQLPDRGGRLIRASRPLGDGRAAPPRELPRRAATLLMRGPSGARPPARVCQHVRLPLGQPRPRLLPAS